MWYLNVAINENTLQLWIPGLLLLGTIAGAIPGLFGAGGGFLLTPALQIFFGLPFTNAVGTSFGQVFLSGSIATFKHNKNDYVDPRLGVTIGVPAILGTALGKHILGLLKQSGTTMLLGAEFKIIDLVLYAMMSALMLLVAVSIIRETRKSSGEEIEHNRITSRIQGFSAGPLMNFPKSNLDDFSLILLPLIGFPVGMLCGMLGIGGGFINFPLLVYVIGIPTHIAIGTSAMMTVLAGGYGAAANFLDGEMLLPVVGIMFLGSLLGTQIGAAIAHRTGGKKLRKYFSLVLAAGMLIIIGKVVLHIIKAH